ncbi:MAG: class I SAM-dependent methyltransferase [Vulcanimicrobiota bacterium]
MASLEENRSFWQSYDWSRGGEEWSKGWGEGGSAFQWQACIYPRLRQFLPAERIVEIGSGFGRFAHHLARSCQSLVGFDLVDKCVEACRERFADQPHLRFELTDGRSLPSIENGSVDFVFSFESLVLAEADVCEAYLHEIARVLRPGGGAFLHHSNLGEYDFYFTLTGLVPEPTRVRLNRLGLIDLSQWRAPTVTAAKFRAMAEAAELVCTSQELVNWGAKRLIDCFTTLVTKGSPLARPTRIVRNAGFMDEVGYLARLGEFYQK